MSRRGMTLIELVVALAITGVMVTAGYGTFTTLADRREIAAERASSVLRDASARAALVSWIAAARLTIEQDEIVFRAVDGTTRGAAERTADDDIVFFTTASTPVSHDGTIVRLFIDRRDESAERGLVAELRERFGPRVLRLELVRNAVSLDGAYLTSLFGRRQWTESWVSTSVLPAGARLTIAAARGDSLPPLWRIPVTVSIEGGR